MADILFLEPFYSGSHKYFADGLISRSNHSVRLVSLPGRHWKWRMESAALEMTGKIRGCRTPDLVFATNLMDLAQWKAFSGFQDLPHILYVHENQLDYPLKKGEKRDFHYGWKDYVNFMAADRIIFNSLYNLNSFCTALTGLAASLPGFKAEESMSRIKNKSLIIPPGCTLVTPGTNTLKKADAADPPVFLWNHRWEHDKNPESFFRVLREVKKRGGKFNLILLGESFRDSPPCFAEAQREFSGEIIHSGFVESRKEYEALLCRSDFVISTALQENFGISVIEAVSAGAIPLLPDRLAYPEVLGREFHDLLLYSDEEDLICRILSMMDKENLEPLRESLVNSVAKYGWEAQIRRFDSVLQETVQRSFSANL